MAFGADGRIVLDKPGQRSLVRFEDDEMDRMFGAAVFTHNHPSDTSFSDDDVELACTLELGELRVVGPTWTHIMRPGPGGWSDRLWLDRLKDECLRSQMYVGDGLRDAISSGKVTLQEANAEFWHLVWERTAAILELDYERHVGDRSDAG